MATIDEIFAAMPEEDAQTGRDYLVIDPATRVINVPESERVFGVEGDANAQRKYFICPRYVGDNLDLASMFLTVNYRNPQGEEDGYLVNDVAIQGDYVTFSWQLWPNAVAYKGTLQFSVCADLPNATNRRGPDWNTTMAAGEVLEGLDPDRGDVEGETSDVVAQLRADVADQTAAVEAAGAAQVIAVQTAGAAVTAEAEAQIEAKGAATLATIPEDYTTMAGKVNEHANAIKGKLSGEIVQASDVSPVEHYLGVKVRGKNLWNMAVITSADGKFTNNGDGTITVHGGEYYCRAAETLAEICPQLRAGDIVKFSINTTGYAGIFLNVANTLVQNGYALTITGAMLASYVALYGVLDSVESFNEPHIISSIQLELGTVATEYTPYIDPAAVTVTRCGKNLWPVFVTDQTYPNGSYTKVNDDGSILLHVAGDNIRFDYMLNLPAGTYTMSNGEHTTTEKKPYIILYETDGPTHYCRETFTIEKPTACKLTVYAWNEYGGDFVFTPQLERGTEATEYEPYDGTTAMPDESGVVTGLPSVSPTMTILTDTAGVTVECEYNRDTNKVYAEILEKIAALSGTT